MSIRHAPKAKARPPLSTEERLDAQFNTVTARRRISTKTPYRPNHGAAPTPECEVEEDHSLSLDEEVALLDAIEEDFLIRLESKLGVTMKRKPENKGGDSDAESSGDDIVPSPEEAEKRTYVRASDVKVPMGSLGFTDTGLLSRVLGSGYFTFCITHAAPALHDSIASHILSGPCNNTL